MDFSPDFDEEGEEKSMGMEDRNGSGLWSSSDTACTKSFCSNTPLSTATFKSSSPAVYLLMKGSHSD